MGLTMQEKKKLTVETAKKYFVARKKEKGMILDVFISQTGYNRKYAIFVLGRTAELKTVNYNSRQKKCVRLKKQKTPRVYKPVYGEDVVQVLEKIWMTFDFKCAQLLVPFIRTNLDYLASKDCFGITPEIKMKLGKISSATVDRKLRAIREKTKLRGISTTRYTSNLNNLIPIRVFFNMNERKPGFFCGDTVAHCGENNSGQYIITFTTTDIGSGWTELKGLLNKAQRWIKESLDELEISVPFPILGFHSDNGDEFKNYTVYEWSKNHEIEFTRTRPYKKNDNCFAEQKNFTEVRALVGYGRYEGEETLAVMNELYKNWCLLINYFYPCLRLKSKDRVNAKVIKRYEEAKTPYQRLLESPDISEDIKQSLREKKQSLDLLELKKNVDILQEQLLKMSIKPK